MDDNFSKIRSSLNAMSSVIILYVTAEGRLSEDGSFFGGTIHFDKPTYLEYAGIIVFLYLLLRYILHTTDALDSINKDWLAFLFTRNNFLKFANTHAPDGLGTNYSNQYLFDSPNDHVHDLIRGRKKPNEMPASKVPPLLLNSFWCRKICYYTITNSTIPLSELGHWIRKAKNGTKHIVAAHLNVFDSIRLTMIIASSRIRFFLICENSYVLLIPYILSVTALACMGFSGKFSLGSE